MRAHSSRFSPYLVAFVMISILMATALISPLYPLYGSSWQLSPSALTQIYVIYMVGALVGLLALGRLADRWGVYRTLSLGLGMALIGTVFSMLAQGYWSFAAARFLVGIGSSLATTGGAVAMAQLMPADQRHRLATMTSLTIIAGFTLGPVWGGIIGHWSVEPLRAVYYVPILLQLVSLGLLLFALPKDSAASQMRGRDLLPKLSWTAPESSLRFALTILVPFIAFGVFGLHASLMPTMLREMTGLSGPLLTGFALGAFLTGAGLAQLLGQRLGSRNAAMAGLGLMAIGTGAMLINLRFGSAMLFSFGGICGMIGHGLSLLGSSKALYEMSTPLDRGALTATYFSSGYSGSVFPLLGVGLIADHWGTTTAVGVFFAASTVLTLALMVAIPLALRKR